MTRAIRWVAPAALFLLLAWQVKQAGDLIRAQRLVRAVEGRTMAMIQSGKLQRAPLLAHVEALREARRLDPADVAARVATGSEYLLLGDLEKARAAYEDALALEPRPEIYLNLGKAWLAEGRTEEARAQFARALKLDPLLRDETPAEFRDARASAPARVATPEPVAPRGNAVHADDFEDGTTSGWTSGSD